jgi:Leucine-rich repeat (LRR) protein
LSTLVELNLSFNNISDIVPLEDLVLLEKLWLNRNHILIIDPLKKLKKLNTLGLFHNEIMNDKRAIEVLEELPMLRDLSIDGNPVSAKVSFKYEIIYRFKNLETLDDDAIKELDRDISEQYFV